MQLLYIKNLALWILQFGLCIKSSAFAFTNVSCKRSKHYRHSSIFATNWNDEEEEVRLKVLSNRRESIRSTLKNAEKLRQFRISNNLVPEIDEETGKPIKSDSEFAITVTAFVVAAGAVTLRVGGRAALVSAVGLDFATENPELRDNMDQFLNYANSLEPGLEGLLFILAWTLVKVFCFDFGGIILAFSAGILFGGVLKGAIFSAGAATIGSSVAFVLAKLDTPVREKALEIIETYPSLRGIEKVVAEDGIKAIITLRLAPLLPIPIGLYNYVYGVTNVPFLDFAGGIFLGSLKPYLLDSYLGYFGKQLVEGTAGESGGLQDFILLAVLGVSILIGVFASQLASETWNSVKEEIETEQKMIDKDNGNDNDENFTRNIMGIELPQWMIGMQYEYQKAEERIQVMIDAESQAMLWNYTIDNPPPSELDPKNFNSSLEIAEAGKGFNVKENIYESIVLSPLLPTAFIKYADPLFNGEDESSIETNGNQQMEKSKTWENDDMTINLVSEETYLLDLLAKIRTKTEESILALNEKLDQ